MFLFNFCIGSDMKKKRENFEYRVAQPTREVKDYLGYIKYERTLITMIKERLKLHKDYATNSIVKMISNRMKQLYTTALGKYPHDTRFWDEYLKFLTHFKYRTEGSAVCDRMLQVGSIGFVRLYAIAYMSY